MFSNIHVNAFLQIKAVLSEENYVPTNHNLSQQAIISSFLCHNDTVYKEWLKSFKYFKEEHAQSQFWSNFEITKCCGDLEHNVKVINT